MAMLAPRDSEVKMAHYEHKHRDPHTGRFVPSCIKPQDRPKDPQARPMEPPAPAIEDPAERRRQRVLEEIAAEDRLTEEEKHLRDLREQLDAAGADRLRRRQPPRRAPDWGPP